MTHFTIEELAPVKPIKTGVCGGGKRKLSRMCQGFEKMTRNEQAKRAKFKAHWENRKG